MKMRKLVHNLIEPYIKQSVEGRAKVIALEMVTDTFEQRINDLEISVFQKTDGGPSIFDQIYGK